jgi:hypothetical protein
MLWQIPLVKMRPHPSGQPKADADTIRTRGYGAWHSEGRGCDAVEAMFERVSTVNVAEMTATIEHG